MTTVSRVLRKVAEAAENSSFEITSETGETGRVIKTDGFVEALIALANEADHS